MKKVMLFIHLIQRVTIIFSDYINEDINEGSFVSRYKNCYHKK
jgi:hypothetical protein